MNGLPKLTINAVKQLLSQLMGTTTGLLDGVTLLNHVLPLPLLQDAIKKGIIGTLNYGADGALNVLDNFGKILFSITANGAIFANGVFKGMLDSSIQSFPGGIKASRGLITGLDTGDVTASAETNFYTSF